ncbi:hypothetical protein DRJ58_03605 [Candidatus Acetothermia bacterium]|nr:MAG: hypothetical protein DRJ58_03605 [Candidatus Acetothermia bacterium]
MTSSRSWRRSSRISIYLPHSYFTGRLNLTSMRSCVFCKIVCGEAPARVVYESEGVLAFLDIRPINEGHTLVIPKRHYVHIWELPDNEVARLFVAARRIAEALREALGASGVRIVQLNGRAAGQEVFHLHIHVIPYYGKAKETPERRTTQKAELDIIAERIRKFLYRDSAHSLPEPWNTGFRS